MNPEVQNLVAAGKISSADAEKLAKLEPGTVVQHKSWGVGKITEWDLLGDRIGMPEQGAAQAPRKTWRVVAYDFGEIGRASCRERVSSPV